MNKVKVVPMCFWLKRGITLFEFNDYKHILVFRLKNNIII